MAPYRIRVMSQSFGDRSTTGLSSLKNKPNPLDPFTYRDDFTRKEMLIWRFIDYDRMMFGKNDPITGRQWMSLGDLYWEYRRPADASVFYRRGLKILRNGCKPTDDSLLDGLKKMANCCLVLTQYDEAEVLFRDIVASIDAKMHLNLTLSEEAKKKTAGKPKPNLRAERIAALLALAETLKRQQKFRETAQAFNDVVDMHEASGHLPGEDCLAVYRELAETYSALGDPQKAELFIATAKQLDFMRIVEQAVGPEAKTLIREMEPLAALYLKRNKYDIVRGLKKRIEVCELVDKVKYANYPGIEKDLERLAVLYDERDQPGDATLSFHLRMRAKRIIEDATTKVTTLMMITAGKLYWVFEAIEGMEAMLASMLAGLF